MGTTRSPRISNAIYATTTLADTLQMLEVDDTAGGKSLDVDKIPEYAEIVVIQAQVAAIRFTTDGSTPVAAGASAHGETLEAGERYVLSPADARRAKFLRDGATNAKLAAKTQSH